MNYSDVAERMLEEVVNYLGDFLDEKQTILEDRLEEIGEENIDENNKIASLMDTLSEMYDEIGEGFAEAIDDVREKDSYNLLDPLEDVFTTSHKEKQIDAEAWVIDIVKEITENIWEPILEKHSLSKFYGDEATNKVIDDLFNVDSQTIAEQGVLRAMNYLLLDKVREEQER